MGKSCPSWLLNQMNKYLIAFQVRKVTTDGIEMRLLEGEHRKKTRLFEMVEIIVENMYPKHHLKAGEKLLL